jgi:hypothetical protein
MKKYGWYSILQAEIAGTSFYSTPDGSKIEVSCVSDNPDDSGCKWDDMVPLGEVCKPLGKAVSGKVDAIEDELRRTGDYRSSGQKLLDLIKEIDKKQTSPHRWN